MPYRSDDPFLVLLKSLSGKNVHFFPKSGNAGDGFIAHATYELFRSHGINFITHHQTDTVEGETVLIGGGGNLVEGRYNEVAELIRRHAEKNQIVLLPHTIVGFADVLAETHRNLTVFCREPVSYQMALLNGASPMQTHLSHDVTFFLDDDYFSRFFGRGEGILKALRTDGETTGQVKISEDNLDMSLSWNGDLWTSPDFCAHVTNSMAAFAAPFETVQTDRLHVSILSAFLKKNVYLLPNAYYKNRAIFEHSIRPRFPKVHFVDTSKDLNEWAPLSMPQLHYEKNASLVAELKSTVDVQKKQIEDLKIALERETSLRENAQRSLQLKRQRWEEKLESYRAALDALRAREERWEEKLESYRAALDALRAREELLTAELATREGQLAAVWHSTSWRLARPLRAIARRVPLTLRSRIRKILRPSA